MRGIILLLFLSLHVKAAVLISVQDQKNETNWNKIVCEKMYEQINTVIPQKASCLTIAPETFVDERIQALRSKGNFHTHIRVFRKANNTIQIDTQQWIVDDETDFSVASFNIDKPVENEQLESLALYSRNWAVYRLNRFQFKADMLEAGLPESKEIKKNTDNEYVDAVTMNPISLQKAYNLYSNESGRNKAYLKTAMQLTAVLGFGVYLYYKNLGSMKVDHDYQGVWPSIKKKLSGEALREDDNNTAANVGHVFAGEIYFLVARNNGLNFIEASLATLASSAIWEFGEYKEVFSINDQIMTGWTGAVVGEVFWQMSRAIKNKSNNIIAQAFAALLNPVGAVQNGFTRLQGFKPKDVHKGDLDLNQFSRFEVSAMIGHQSFKGAKQEEYKGIAVKGEVINIPDWDKPGSERQLLLETPVSELEFVVTKSRFGVEDFKLVTQAILVGVYGKNRTERDGYEYIIGLSSGFEWDQKRSGPLAFEKSNQVYKDFWARAHLIGSTIRAFGLYKGIKITLEMKVHADYVLVSSYALEELEHAEGGREGLLSVMKKRGYYYGTGWSHGLKGVAEYNNWQVGWNYNRTDVSNSGLPHRFDNEITKPYEYSDSRSENRLFIKRIINRDWSVDVAVMKINREGTISSLYAKKSSEKRTEVRLQYIW